MTKQTLADLLVLSILFIGNARFLLIKKSKKDSLSVVPFFALFFSLVNVFVFTLSFENFLISILAFWSSLWNIRAVYRAFTDSIFDRYGLRLSLICALNTILTVLLIVCTIYFRPMDIEKTKLPIRQETILYSGNFQEGYLKIEKPFSFTSLSLSVYSPKSSSQGGRKIVLFVPPETTTPKTYAAFFQKLAFEGFYVYSAELYPELSFKFLKHPLKTRFFRHFIAIKNCFFNRVEYEKKIDTDALKETFWALLSLSSPHPQDTVFLVTEDDFFSFMPEVKQLSFGVVKGSYDLSYIEEYKTKGFGPLENTDPFLGVFMGVSPDLSGYMSSHLGAVLVDFIKSQEATEN